MYNVLCKAPKEKTVTKTWYFEKTRTIRKGPRSVSIKETTKKMKKSVKRTYSDSSGSSDNEYDSDDSKNRSNSSSESSDSEEGLRKDYGLSDGDLYCI